MTLYFRYAIILPWQYCQNMSRYSPLYQYIAYRRRLRAFYNNELVCANLINTIGVGFIEQKNFTLYFKQHYVGRFSFHRLCGIFISGVKTAWRIFIQSRAILYYLFRAESLHRQGRIYGSKASLIYIGGIVYVYRKHYRYGIRRHRSHTHPFRRRAVAQGGGGY